GVWRLTGVDKEPAAAAAGAPYCERLIVADTGRGLPAVGGPLDAIVYADGLEHLADPAGALAYVDRDLAPGGDVILSVPNVAHLWMRLSLLAGRFQYGPRGILDATHLRFFT